MGSITHLHNTREETPDTPPDNTDSGHECNLAASVVNVIIGQDGRQNGEYYFSASASSKASCQGLPRGQEVSRRESGHADRNSFRND